MFRKFWLALVVLPCMVMAAQESETIKVLIADRVQSPMVEVTGGYRILNPATQRYVGTGLRGKRFPVQAQATGLKWGEEFPAVYQITLQPRREETHILIDGIAYEGSVHIYGIDGRVSIVNEVPVETYVAITLTQQFEEPKRAEVMNAVAIAARTHAFYDAQHNADAFWHVRDSAVDYVGGLRDTASGAVDRAVRDTQHIVLNMGGESGAYFPAVWTGNSAGRTAPYHLLFGKNGRGLVGVETPLARRDRDQVAWEVAVPSAWLARAARLSAIQTVSPYTDPESKKVYAVRLSDGERLQDINFFKLQQAVGVEKLRSSEFTAEVKEDQILFRGYGEGHGVGLCLYTAGLMARDGSNAAEILATFFPGSTVEMTAPAERPKRKRNRHAHLHNFELNGQLVPAVS